MIFIPWSDLGVSFDKIPELLFQLFRRQTNGNLLTAKYHVLFPTSGFHNYSPEYFGQLEFIKQENLIKNGSSEELTKDGFPIYWQKKAQITQDSFEGKK
jgi:hypothetical protein